MGSIVHRVPNLPAHPKWFFVFYEDLRHPSASLAVVFPGSINLTKANVGAPSAGNGRKAARKRDLLPLRPPPVL